MTEYRKKVVCSNSVSKVIRENHGVCPEIMERFLSVAFPLWENKSSPMHDAYSEVKKEFLKKYEEKWKRRFIEDHGFEDPT